MIFIATTNSSEPPRGRESHKWEPTQSAAPGLNPTHSECSPRPGALRSTQSDGGRHPEPPWTSLTRKRSLVQIQYGPRHFSKLCLAVRAAMRASHLRFWRFVAGQSTSRCGPHRRRSPGLACSAADLSSCRGNHSGAVNVTEGNDVCAPHRADRRKHYPHPPCRLGVGGFDRGAFQGRTQISQLCPVRGRYRQRFGTQITRYARWSSRSPSS